jgi:ABC-type phosphate/phosphonate transport system ATPase subunit
VTSPVAVQLAGVGVRFEGRDVTALSEVTASISAGERVAIVGASGSGKTTLLRALVGAVDATGLLDVGGLDPGNVPHRRTIRRGTGILRQGGDLVPVLSGRLNAVMGCAHGFTTRDWAAVLTGRTPSGLRDRLAELAGRHEVVDCLDAPVNQLSGGQRQRIALIRAVLGQPGLLLADEPTTGLDPVAADRIITDILAEVTCTTLVTTHDLAAARRFPRVIGIRGGRIVHDGPTVDRAAELALYGGAS